MLKVSALSFRGILRIRRLDGFLNQFLGETNSMKLRVGVIVASLGISSSAVLAQGEVTSAAGSINAPAPSLTFNPSIASGMHGVQEISGKSGSYTAGPFLTPSFESSYKSPSLTVGLDYEVEIGSSRGFGDTEDKTFAGNTYIQHHPVLKINGGPSKIKFNGVIDWTFTLNNSAAKLGENKSDLGIVPGITYDVDPSLTLTADAWVQRVNYFDGATVDADVANNVKSSKEGVSEEQKAAFASAKKAIGLTAGQSPMTTLYAGSVGLKKKFTDSLKLTVYARAGHRVANYVGGEAKAYRLHAHLDFATPIANLTGFTRCRLNVYDTKGGEIAYQPYNLSQLSYEISRNWSVVAQNELAITKDTTGNGKAVKIENENYLGASYKF